MSPRAAPKRITKHCIYCATEFSCRTWDKSVHCSRKCVWGTRKASGRFWVQKTCTFCLSEFTIRACEDRKGRGKYCSHSCAARDHHGERGARWAGGKTGYVATTSVSGRRMAQHRAIAEVLLGRRLERTEVVHHKNGVRCDNRPENLEVMSLSDHTSMHKSTSYWWLEGPDPLPEHERRSWYAKERIRYVRDGYVPPGWQRLPGGFRRTEARY